MSLRSGLFFNTRAHTTTSREKEMGVYFPSFSPPTTTWLLRLQTQILFPEGIGPGPEERRRGRGKITFFFFPPFFRSGNEDISPVSRLPSSFFALPPFLRRRRNESRRKSVGQMVVLPPSPLFVTTQTLFYTRESGGKKRLI